MFCLLVQLGAFATVYFPFYSYVYDSRSSIIIPSVAWMGGGFGKIIVA